MAEIIQPLSLPDGSGINLAGGDVKHFSSDDEFGAAAIQQSTRQLAYRDTLLAQKVNELISQVNNKEQFVPLPAVRTILPPSVLETTTNFRIPVGFEARVLNASVKSSNDNVVLKVVWNPDFGGDTGVTEIVNTLSEISSGTTFFGAGEFIVQLQNQAGTSAETICSILLTMRPIGITAGGLIGPGVVGPQGPPGPQGSAGATGSPGAAGPAGSPGLVWRGTWNETATYATNDVVRYNYAGSGYSSYVSLVPNSAETPPDPAVAPNGIWDLVAQSGAATGGTPGTPGTPGAPGAPGVDGLGFTVLGVHNPELAYGTNQVVTVSFGGSYYRTYVAKGSIPPYAQIVGGGANVNWVEMFGPSYSTQIISGSPQVKFTTYESFVPGTTIIGNPGPGADSPPTYLGSTVFSSGSREYMFTFQEMTWMPSSAWLQAVVHANCAGSFRVELPQRSNGARVDWNNSLVGCIVTSNGTLELGSSNIPLVDVRFYGTRGFDFHVRQASPVQFSVSMVGFTGQVPMS